MNYNFINNFFLSNIIKIIPKFIIKKIRKRFNWITFIPTKLNYLPAENHPVIHRLAEQEKYLEDFNKFKEQTSKMTCPYLIQFLTTIYESNKKFKFLDIGGENIDFFLELKAKFNNLEYYIHNQKKVLENLEELKKKYFFKDFYIIPDLNKIYNDQFEFINLGSCIQYLEDYKKIINLIIKISKEYIFFSATHFFKNKKNNIEVLVAKQINFLPKVFYCYFFERESFLNFFTKNSFEIIFEKKNITDNINYDNFLQTFKDVKYTDILLKNKKKIKELD